MDASSNVIIKDSRRWIVILAFSILNFSNAIGYVNINSVAGCASLYYNRPIDLMLTVANSSNLIFIVLGWLAIPLLNWRIDYSIIGAAIFSCASYWMRWIAHGSFFAALLGSFLNSIAQVVILPACIYIPEVWFPMEQRNLAFGVPFYFNMLGMNFGYIFPVEFIPSDCSNLNKITQMQFICAVISTFSLIVCLTLIRNKPKSPPNKKYLQSKRLSFRNSFHSIFCNAQNLFNISVLALFLGLSWSLYDILGFVFGSFNYNIDNTNTVFSTTDIGILCLCFSLSGILFGFMSSFHIMHSFMNQRKPKVDLFIKLFLIIGFVSLVVLSTLVALNNEMFYWYVLIMIFCGAGFNSFIPSACQSLVENLFPAKQLVTITVFFVFSNIFTQCLTGVAQLNLLGDQGFAAICCATVIPLLYVVLCLFTEFKRHDFVERRRLTEDIKLEMASNDEAVPRSLVGAKAL